MGKVYSLRQTKIYEDYSSYSTDHLMEMIKSEKYVDEVTDILVDIMIERNAIPPENKQGNSGSQAFETEETYEIKTEELITSEGKARETDVNFYLKQLERSSDKDISEIITKHTSYQLASVEAALIIAERRGTISSYEKKALLARIEKRFLAKEVENEVEAHQKRKKSSGHINSGLILAAVGLILTIGTWIHPIGGYSIAFYGLIVSGVYLIYKGFFMID